MKKYTIFLAILIALSLFAGCSANSDSIEKTAMVGLCDLDSIAMEDSVFGLSEKELESVIAAKFSAVDIEIDPANLTDKDAAMLNCDSVSEFKHSIVTEIVTHRLVEEYYNYLLENSTVETNENTDTFVNTVCTKTQEIAAREGYTFDGFVEEQYQMDKEEFKNHLIDLWVNMQIIFAYCDSHDIICTETDFAEAKDFIKDSEEFECYTGDESIESDLIRFFVLDENLQNSIAEMHNEEITQYSAKIMSTLS